MKHVRTLDDLSTKDIKDILALAARVKKSPKRYRTKLVGKSIALLFEKPSTRTRMSFEVGIAELGATPIVLDWQSTQLGRAALCDEVRCIARYVDAIGARVRSHMTLEEMSHFAKRPIINMLSDKAHPCQALGDMFTISEHFSNLKKVKLVYISDGNNVCNSLITIAMKMGMKITLCCPKGYDPDTKILRAAKKKGTVTIERNPQKACKGADVIYTDTWISMGQEKQAAKRRSVFKKYKVTKKLLSKARFMHCLPAFRGEEVTDEVMDSHRSIVFDQAENRLHVQKAMLINLLS